MIKADLSEPMYFEHDMSINVSYGHYYSHFPTHWHSYMEIVAPLSNDMTMTLGNETYTLTKNQIVLVPPPQPALSDQKKYGALPGPAVF